MQSSNAAPQAEAILEWLQQEMGYRPQSPYTPSEKLLPSVENLRRICRGNMLPVWGFLLERVKSEKTVEIVKRNILVHGTPASSPQPKASEKKIKEIAGKEKDTTKLSIREKRRLELKGRVRPGETAKVKDSTDKEKEKAPDPTESRDRAIHEREAAEFEIERLRLVLDRLRKDLKGRMLELSREEGERQELINDRTNCRQRQVLLEAYEERCGQTSRIFTEYQRRLHHYVDHALNVQKEKSGSSVNDSASDALAVRNDMDTVYATSVTGGRAADGQIFIETATERHIRVSCELLAALLIEKIQNTCAAYDGGRSQKEGTTEGKKVVVDANGELVPANVKDTALSLLNNPPQLLYALAAYTSRVVASIIWETDKIDIKADAERLRYKYENNRIFEDASVDVDESFISYNKVNKDGMEGTAKGTFQQLRERQRAHVQQFMATEEALNAAASARKVSEELVKRIHAGSSSDVGGNSRQFELDVWSKERELTGLKASVTTLNNEVQRLRKMCDERKAAEEALQKKWKRIEEFDARRMELEAIYIELLRINMATAASWEQHTKLAKDYSENTVVPICVAVQQKVVEAHDLIEKEVTIFQKIPYKCTYSIPCTPRALLDSMGVSAATGPEALTLAERTADLLMARAGVGDPSAMPSICRINSITKRITGYDGMDVGLAAVVEALQFLFSPFASPACLTDNLAKAMSQVQTLRNLVGNGRLLLTAANSTRPDYERSASACTLSVAEQEKVALEHWLPELKVAIQDAVKCIEDCKRVRGMVDEWWEQPAAIAVDWVTVDGQNVAAWLAHVKQLQTAFYDKLL